MRTIQVAIAVAAFVPVNTHAPDIASAAQFKPVIQAPRIMIRPPIVTPQSRRLLKKDSPGAVTNPAATQGGSAPEADTPSRSRSPSPLRQRARLVTPIPWPKPRPNPLADIMENLYRIFRESIEATNEDKKYFLHKIKIYRAMGEAFSAYLTGIMQALEYIPMAERRDDDEDDNDKD
jgi:hypothetical protein